MKPGTRISAPVQICVFALVAGISFLGLNAFTAGRFAPPDASDNPAPAAKPSSENAVDAKPTGSVRAQPVSAIRIQPENIASLKAGLDALSENDIAAAKMLRDNLPTDSLDRKILDWAMALSGSNAVSSREIAATARELAGWPGMDALRRNSERALLNENLAPRDIIHAFGGTPPETAEGVIVLARAHVALGDTKAARAILTPFWRAEKLDAKDETAILREFGDLILQPDHLYRMERMLHADRVNSAERVAPFAHAVELAAAWGAVIRNQDDAGKLLVAVPETQRDANYIHARAKYLRRSGKFMEAAKVLADAPADPALLVDPDSWWVERRVLSRELLDIDEAAAAYQVAADHSGEGPVMAADAEFHAGWYALRSLNDAKTAARHFSKIIHIAEGPISLARGYYWLGRAAEAGAPGDATADFEQAAQFGTTYYGQLASARLGRDIIAAAYPEPSAADRLAFAARPTVEAIRRLEEAGHEWRAGILYRDLASEMTSAGELALLSAMAEARGDHYLALRVGKIAASRGLDIGALSHPVGAIPASADISNTGKALAYAVARQESEFNVGAVSGAGARGLLQLMPGTAKDMAELSGLAYPEPRLTADAGYNATLGAAFLGQQLDRFDGSYILTFIGYNAGPRRAADWVKRYGDPRGKDIDAVVDWVERIPFTETRSYVQRVMENYETYQMRLTGHFDIEKDLTAGRQG